MKQFLHGNPTIHTVGITIDNANALQKTTSDSGSQAADQTWSFNQFKVIRSDIFRQIPYLFTVNVLLATY